MKAYETLIEKAWSLISPAWPLQNFIAVNPLSGFQHLNFEDAIQKDNQYFLYEKGISELELLNLHTIKWCQVFFDEGQSIITMPDKKEGFFPSWKKLVPYDVKIHQNNPNIIAYLKGLPENSSSVISEVVHAMKLSDQNALFLFEMMLMSLKGWAGYIKYLSVWMPQDEKSFLQNTRRTLMMDYLAVRLVLYRLLTESSNLFSADATNAVKNWSSDNSIKLILDDIKKSESSYTKKLLNLLHQSSQSLVSEDRRPPAAIQCIFCIDVRSEPIRRLIEQKNDYKTFGFAGFFGAPVKMKVHAQDSLHYAAPVLLSPQHTAEFCLCEGKKEKRFLRNNRLFQQLKKTYASAKYNIGSPCVLAETLGPFMGLWMLSKTFFPKLVNYIRKKFYLLPPSSLKSLILTETIDIEIQVNWAETLIKMLNLTNHFGNVIILFGHAAKTENNAYASALECGACGANQGGYNAQLMAEILNQTSIRKKLESRHIFIPKQTCFIAAEHITTNQKFQFYNLDHPLLSIELKKKIQKDFAEISQFLSKKSSQLKMNSINWAETRPEWGLAKNGAFIIGPRQLTASIDLEGRAFLHSYDWEVDHTGTNLEVIMTAPMIVAQWINHQYLFSTINNMLYGGGSKITQNITGKKGIMQGNASDLMPGLSLQATFETDEKRYHHPQRLLVIVYAPRKRVQEIIEKHKILQDLFFNQWLFLSVIEPKDKTIYTFQCNNKLHITWEENHEAFCIQ